MYRPRAIDRTIIPPSVFSSSRLRKEDGTRERKGMSEHRGSIRRRRPDAFAALLNRDLDAADAALVQRVSSLASAAGR